MNFIKKDVFAISYHVKRLFRGKDGKVERESAPSAEKTIHVAAGSQEDAVVHAKDYVNAHEVGGEKDTKNRLVTVTSVANGTKAANVHIAPIDGLVPESEVEAKVAEAKKGLFTQDEVNAKIAEALRAGTPPK